MVYPIFLDLFFSLSLALTVRNDKSEESYVTLHRLSVTSVTVRVDCFFVQCRQFWSNGQHRGV